MKIHIDYWWCFEGNVQGLRDEIGGLEREMSNMVQEIEEARYYFVDTTGVKNWLNEVTQKLEEATGILQGCVDIKPWHIKSRYLVGKSAKEIAEGIAKLRNEGNLIRITDPAPPAAMVSIPHAPTLEFQSRKRIEEDIMKSLKDENVRMIAICGAGGVGKTRMAQRIEDRVRKEKLFDEVVLVVVSQQIDMFKIQKQIAEMLGLGLREETLEGRAHKLRTWLMDSMKKLIIFDDVWKSFELKDIGVPPAYERCKIILTSRLKDVCEEMEANKIIEIQVLDKEEAWTLFREKSGVCVDDLHLRPIAGEVAAECKGLPVALVTIGKALQNKNINIWEDALSQMRKSNPIDFQRFLKNVYMPLKLSYDFLETESEKSLFLLCCLFPEDHNIRIENLALLSFGLGMFEGIDNIEDGRNRTYHLLERLRSRFLLMTGENEEEVKMHNVVRDVAIFIGSKEKQGFLNVSSMDLSSEDSSRNCNWMSVEISDIVNAKLPVMLDFPNLCLLMIRSSSYFEFPQGFDFNNICQQLTVLYFLNGSNFQSLPLSLKFLKKLRMLLLDRCKVKDISVVGELTSLEILHLWHCNQIEELPADVGNLKFLRLLELIDCKKLERIVAGVISSLVELEELKIVDCFNKWEVKGNLSEERNASLSELESLCNLTSLEIDIFDPNFVGQEMSLSKHLRRYQIRSYKDRVVFDPRKIMKDERKIELYLPRDVTVENWIQRLVKNTQSLALEGDGSNYFNLGEIESLRKLVLQNCSTVEEIIDGTIPEGSNSFQNLESIDIDNCPKLRYLWNSPNQNVYLVNLKSIYISNCPNLQDLFSVEKIFRDDGNRHIIFQELRELTLEDLSCLTTFYRGVESIKFPKLRVLRIRNLPRLNSFVAIDSEHTHDLYSLHLFCNKKVEIFGLEILYLKKLPDKLSQIWCRHIPISFFHNLERLFLYEVDGIRNLISSSIAKALVNLNVLSISHCKEMIDVIEDETHVTVDLVLPKLEHLSIIANCKLRSFCQWKHVFELPSLEKVQIENCPLMKTFTLGSLSTPKLREFQINHQDIEMKDLNGGIHHFITTEITNKDNYNEDEKHVYSGEDKKEIEEEKAESSNNNFM